MIRFSGVGTWPAVLLIVGLFFAGPALAAPVTITWQHPTAYVDGRAIAAGDIDHYRLWCNSAAWPPLQIIAGEFNTVTLELVPGVYECWLKTVVLCPECVDGKPLVSADSEHVTFTVPEPPPPEPVQPTPPTGVAAELSP